MSLSRNGKRIVAGLTLLVAAGLTAYGLTKTVASEPVPTKDELPLVRVMTVAPNTVSPENIYAGEVRGRRESQVAFLVGGRITSRHVEVGSHVHRGQLLMQIDPQDVQQTVNSYSAQVAAARSQLQLAERNLARYRQLCEQDVISRAQLERHQSTYDTAQAAYEQAQAVQTQGKNQLAYTRLCANRSGVVSAIFGEAGQVVGPGQPVVSLVEDGEREIEISIPEQRVAEVHRSPSVKISFWAFPKLLLEGKIREVAPMADPLSRTYKVRVALATVPPEIELGMTASVRIASSGAQPGAAVLAPLSAIYQTKESAHVWAVDNGTVHLRTVKTGAFSGDQVEITDGLAPGTVIVTAGVHKLREGLTVRTQAGE